MLISPFLVAPIEEVMLVELTFKLGRKIMTLEDVPIVLLVAEAV